MIGLRRMEVQHGQYRPCLERQALVHHLLPELGCLYMFMVQSQPAWSKVSIDRALKATEPDIHNVVAFS
jgi:hypothetical protein